MLNVNNPPRFGSDPEAFFTKAGQIIGSEKLIPEKGIRSYSGKIVRDGVQFELNPTSDYSVPALARSIGHLFQLVQKRVAQNPGVGICFDGVVEVSREELDSLSPACRILGCMPSYNIYEERPINVDPIEYRKRSSGGHIHFGINDRVLMNERRRIVPLLDVLVGNTSVLLDRDPGAAERRQNYGRAGEFRLPDHGLEYRTTSNFWLRNYTLMDFTFGMARIAYAVAFQSFNGDKAIWEDLAKRVSIRKIVQAIDENDYDLALKNFKKIVPFLKKRLPQEGFVLNPKNLDNFVDFAESAKSRGIQSYFPDATVVNNWVSGKYMSFSEFVK